MEKNYNHLNCSFFLKRLNHCSRMKIKINFEATLCMLSPDHSLVEFEATISNRDVYRKNVIYFTIAFVGITATDLNTSHILINHHSA